MSKFFIVAKREYLKVITKPTFWITTLAFPVFIGILMGISIFANMSSEDTIKESTEVDTLAVYDETGLINPQVVQALGYTMVDSKDVGISQVQNYQVDAFIYYPADLLETKTMQTYTNLTTIFAGVVVDNIGKQLITQSGLSQIPNPEMVQAMTMQFTSENTVFENGEETASGLGRLVVPAVAVVIYFILTAFATSYLLMSVSEEKENRVIEIVLSTIKSKSLIFGKIIGQVGIVLTQVLFLMLLSLIVLFIFKDKLPVAIDLSGITVSIGQILLASFYAFLSFFILACTMVGVGAAMPNYKDAQSFSSIFILLSIIPIYFVTTIIADPTGTVAKVLSYLPFTNGIVLLFRSTLGALTPIEIILSGAVLILYAVIAVFVAFRLFEIGSLEYSRKITLREFRGIFKRR